MRNRLLIALCAVLAVLATEVQGAPGDAFVPAHRTRDGHYVPPNVPPLSGGTHLARRPGHRTSATKHRSARASRLLPPLLVEARPIRH